MHRYVNIFLICANLEIVLDSKKLHKLLQENALHCYVSVSIVRWDLVYKLLQNN